MQKSSFETLRQIAAVPTDPKYRPVQPVYIRAVSLENVPRQEREAPAGPVTGGSNPRSPETRPGRLHQLLPPPTREPPDQPGTPVAHEPGTTTQPAARAER